MIRLGFVGFAAMWATCAVAQEPTRRSHSIDMLVSDVNDAFDALETSAEAVGGWVDSRDSNGQLRLRVPVERLTEWEASLAPYEVASRSRSGSPLGEEIAAARSALRSRREGLDRYALVLKRASSDALFQVHLHVVEELAEVEKRVAQLAALEASARFATVRVYARVRRSEPPPVRAATSFDWIDAVLAPEVRGRAWAQVETVRLRGRPLPAPPPGFAAAWQEGALLATSPGGALVHVFTVVDAPEADASFWAEAVREAFVATGYTITRDEPWSVDALPGHRIAADVPDPAGLRRIDVVFAPDGARIQVVAGLADADRDAGLTEAVSVLSGRAPGSR